MFGNLRAMNPEQAGALFRTVLQVIGTIVSTRGWMQDDEWTAISGALLTIAVTIWGIWARSDRNLIVSAANVPAVKEVVTETTQLATSIPNEKVIPPTAVKTSSSSTPSGRMPPPPPV